MKQKVFRKVMSALLCASVLTSCLGISGIWAQQTKSAKLSRVNTYSTGNVSVQIAEFMLDEDGNEVEYQEPDLVMPGNQISKIVRVTNKAVDCYVRVQTDVSMENEVPDPVTQDDFYGVSDDWVRKGNTYYYTKVLPHGESVDLIEGITIPTEWDVVVDENGNETNPYADNRINAVFSLEAVQSENFSPDFSSDDPWGNIEIEDGLHDDWDYTSYKSEPGNSGLSIVYKGKASKLISGQKDFFTNFKTFMPGDEQSGTLTIKAQNKPVQISFRSETVENQELLDNTSIEITAVDGAGNSTSVYSGTLGDSTIRDWIDLGEFAPKESGELQFKLTFPESVGNKLSAQTGKVKWYFYAEEIEEEEPKKEPETEEPKKTVPPASVGTGSQYMAPKTGDWTSTIPFVVLVIGVAGIAGSSVVLVKARNDKDN